MGLETTINTNNQRPAYDKELVQMADYIHDYKIDSDLAFKTARYCLLDSLGCGLLALNFPECTKLLGPIVPGMTIEQGARVPGTNYELDPVKAAFDIGTIIRWLDYNDTWLAAEWGHPSDNLGGILAVMDRLSREQKAKNTQPLIMRDCFKAMIKAHELQGVTALENSFNRVGLDHVVLVKVATAGVVSQLLGATKEQTLATLSHAWLDGQSLRTYRHSPNTGSRKSWAAGDATSRGVRLAMLVMQGEPGYPSALSAPVWGFNDVLFKGKSLQFKQGFASYVMENILFKISYPAEFHGQTAVECALKLHNKIKAKLSTIDNIKLYTQASAVRIINKTGPLHNPADRDHCLQYMVAVSLLEGSLTAESYSDQTAQNPAIDKLREKMQVIEAPEYSKDYLDPKKRSIANKIEITFTDGTKPISEEVHYPVGHKTRREEGIPLLMAKFEKNLASRFDSVKVDKILSLIHDESQFDNMPVCDFIEYFAE